MQTNRATNIEMQSNQCYIITTEMPMKTNECYGTTDGTQRNSIASSPPVEQSTENHYEDIAEYHHCDSI